MTDTKRLTLIREVAETIFHNTESWTEAPELGGNIAYLLAAITNYDPQRVGTSNQCVVELTQDSEFLAFLRETFDAGHKVWEFVEIDNKD